MLKVHVLSSHKRKLSVSVWKRFTFDDLFRALRLKILEVRLFVILVASLDGLGFAFL
jgi:hypothetical protein